MHMVFLDLHKYMHGFYGLIVRLLLKLLRITTWMIQLQNHMKTYSIISPVDGLFTHTRGCSEADHGATIQAVRFNGLV